MDVSQYLEIFIDETREHLQSLNEQILVLEREPENVDTINEIFRAAHSLKGMAGTMGFKRMQHLTHDMENVFQEVRSDKISVDSAMIDLLFKCLDALDQYLENVKGSSDIVFTSMSIVKSMVYILNRFRVYYEKSIRYIYHYFYNLWFLKDIQIYNHTESLREVFR